MRTLVLLLAAVVASVPPGFASGAACKPAEHCCLTGFSSVEVDGDFVTIDTTFEGQCETTGVLTIICRYDAIDGSCETPLHGIQFSDNNLQITPANGIKNDAACISGDCLQSSSVAGVHYFTLNGGTL